MDDEYPKIQVQAKKELAEIYWGDETEIRNDSQNKCGYALKSKTPVIRLNTDQTSTNIISAITNQGMVRFKLFEGGMKVGIMIDFYKRLIQSAKKKIFLIVDNLRVHHARIFKARLIEHTDRGILFTPRIHRNYIRMNISIVI
jgi:hypothetical protein